LIKIIKTERIQDGVERLIFSAGEAAIKSVQDLESKVLRVSELLEVQIDKVESTLQKAVAEWKELRRDKERLTNRLAMFMAEKYMSKAETVGILKIVSAITSEEEADVNLHIKVANKVVQMDSCSVAVLISVGEKVQIVAMVGDEAQKLGIDAKEITNLAASEVGGGGSGKSDFAQGGGTKVENASKALEKAKMVIQKKLKGEWYAS
ncbi:MAG: DHHA1 domain-containing protein, partial [Candidatus Bathyarchaeia archaeon]